MPDQPDRPAGGGPPPPRPGDPTRRLSTPADPTRRLPDPTDPTRRVSTPSEPTQRLPLSEPPYQASTPYGPTQAITPPTGTPPPPPPSRPTGLWRPVGCSTVLLGGVLMVVLLFIVALLVAIGGYFSLAAELPSPDELRSRELTFASSQIYDSNDQLLYEVMDPTGGRRTYVPIAQISPYLIQATVATEDRNFYQHPGFDPIAIARAIYYALREREVVSGASTITQQVARNLLLDPTERTEQSARRKIKEIILAAELNRRYTKDEILEIYLNNINYGSFSYGIDAAARTYFGTTAHDLTLAQASFLAGLPQSPATYDPFSGGRDAALKRQRDVLSLMVEAGYITPEQRVAAAAEMAAYEFRSPFSDRIEAPHFVFYVRQWVETHLGPDMLYRGSGLRIHTTLNRDWQRLAQEEVTNGVAALAPRQVSNGALVAIEPATGYIRAMVGSADFYNEAIGGQVNVILRCRQPGSAIKPLTYLAAFERGWTPATILWDLPVTYTDTAGNVYRPVNYDGLFRGPVSIRSALANSLNIPAVKALEYVGVNGLLELAGRLGATSIVSPQLECPDYPYESRPLYGLALTLGGGEMKPLELTAAYATFANQGVYVPPTPILYIEDHQGNILVDNRVRQGQPVVSPQLAYLLTSILADTQARCLVFRCPSLLELPGRPVAAKTGTTNDYRDSWTIGYTPDLAVGVWVGNNDNSPMDSVAGSSGAAPIWHAFMVRALERVPASPFRQPVNIVTREICTLSGAQPSPYCPERRTELFALNQLPPGPERDWIREVELDQNSGLRANQDCQTNVQRKVMLVLDEVRDPAGQEWLRQWAAARGLEVAPTDFCTSGSGGGEVRITRPIQGETLYGTVEIVGTVDVPEFDRYEVLYGIGDAPIGFGWVSGPHLALVKNGALAVWDTSGLEPGLYTLRVVAYNKRGAQFEARVLVTVVGPTATPTPTLAPTLTPTPTPAETFTPTPTVTPLPTWTPEPPTWTPEPPTWTPEPPTWTPEPPTWTPEPPPVTPEPPTATP